MFIIVDVGTAVVKTGRARGGGLKGAAVVNVDLTVVKLVVILAAVPAL